MIRYDLAQMASRRGRIRGIDERLSARRQHHAALRTVLRGLQAEVKESVLPTLREDRRLTTDAARQEWFAGLRRVIAFLVPAATRMVERVLKIEGERHTKEFERRAKAALGVDLAAVLRSSDLDEVMAARLAANVALIQGLAEETTKAIEQIVVQASLNGQAMKAVQSQLTQRFAMSDRRAALIARDQQAKWSSDLNRVRQQQAGVTEYTWRTSADERVRIRHRQLQGEVYKWGKPTGAEEGLPPGQPIQCRCVADPIIRF